MAATGSAIARQSTCVSAWPASSGSSTSAGMIARSWNSRIAKLARPWRAVSSPRSASTCSTSAVDDSDSANAMTSAVAQDVPSAMMAAASTAVVSATWAAPAPNTE